VRYLALDVGDERIGVAVSDAGGLIARPLEVIPRVRGAASFRRIVALIEAYGGATDGGATDGGDAGTDIGVVGIVVGWPLLPDGSEGAQVRSTAAYIRGLQRHTDLPIIRYDERHSTARARELAVRTAVGTGAGGGHRTDNLDALAAAVILQEFLNERAE